MDETIEQLFQNSKSADKEVNYPAYQQILLLTEEKVDWAYFVWGQLLEDLDHPNNHQRSRAAQYLANLAKSDPENRMLTDFPRLWQVTKDEKFVTARHSLQAIWKVALAGPAQKEMVLGHLTERFLFCEDEKNFTLVRSDILQGMRQVYDETHDEQVKQTAIDLIEGIDDPKYKKKYTAIWK